MSPYIHSLIPEVNILSFRKVRKILRNIIKHKQKGWKEKMELNPQDYEIQRWIEKLDQEAIRYESKWGIGTLQKLAPAHLAEKWNAQCEKLNDAISGSKLPDVAALVDGSIRGYAALEAAAIAAGHTPARPNVWEAEHPESGRRYRIAVNEMDARACACPGVCVYTLHEVINILEKNQLVNVIKNNARAAKKESAPFDFARGDDMPEEMKVIKQVFADYEDETKFEIPC